MSSWSLGILCFNEVENIETTIKKAHAVLVKLAQPFEILIIDDGSTDGSQDAIKQAIENIPEARIIEHIVNKGIGEALHTFYESAKNENVVYTPGDGQFDYEELFLVPTFKLGYYVSFYRIENTTYSLFRNILTLINKKINAVFLGLKLRDVNWVKIYKNEDLKNLNLQIRSSLIESEISAKLFFIGRKIIEIESKYLPRAYGQSKGASWAILKKAIFDTMLLIRVIGKFRRQQKNNRFSSLS
jgi:glycosyltransferase involved in cell wall biosynthesis